jgi:hypothetical protein
LFGNNPYICFRDSGAGALYSLHYLNGIAKPKDNMNTNYFKFRVGYGIRIEKDNLADAIILAKASAILAGHSEPKLASVLINNTDTIHFCAICGNEVVLPSKGEDTCYKCLTR